MPSGCGLLPLGSAAVLRGEVGCQDQAKVPGSNLRLVIHEDRFLKAMWPQVGEVHDLHFGPAHGTFFTTREALLLENRFPPPEQKKKKL